MCCLISPWTNNLNCSNGYYGSLLARNPINASLSRTFFCFSMNIEQAVDQVYCVTDLSNRLFIKYVHTTSWDYEPWPEVLRVISLDLSAPTLISDHTGSTIKY